MNTNDPTHMLAVLEIASRSDATRLKELEEALSVSLRSGRQFGTQHGLPEAANLNWQRNWDVVETILDRTSSRMNEMAGALGSHESGHLDRATSAWEAIQCEGDQLHDTLASIRTMANELDAEGRRQWNQLAGTLESELETIHDRAEALRIKLELQKSHSKEDTERLVQSIVSKLPTRKQTNVSEDVLYDHEFRKAVIELQREQHEFLGYQDVIKGLLMWAETPDSRMRRNRSLNVSI